MNNELITYQEMCGRENTTLQRGMNYRPCPDYSIFLMSTRKGAPYKDKIEDEGRTLIYEGHDQIHYSGSPNPKKVDQPRATRAGALTENGKFEKLAKEHKNKNIPPEPIRIYEKIKSGIWSYNGLFALVDCWIEHDGQRNVFKFKLVLSNEPDPQWQEAELSLGRLIPSAVKQKVYMRDKGRCVKCGAKDNLHFDHILPWSRGGASRTEKNIQLLCARHNIKKGAKLI